MTHVFLIGIGGAGMSAIARVLLECGYVVSGSDRSLSPLAADLRAAGVTVYEGHAAENIAGADIVVRSSAIPDDNVEVQAARKAGIPVLKRYDFLNQLTREKKLVAVAGSHGKTTTSSMLAWAMTAQQLDPSYILGGVSRNLAGNAHAGKGQYFVLEADEYDHMFLGLKPDCILLTNVEYDHPDCYPTVPEYHAAFTQFIGLLQPGGILVTDSDQPASAEMLAALPSHARAVTFALASPADYRAVNLVVNTEGGLSFDVMKTNSTAPLAHMDLQVPGEHNVRNALGVLVVMDSLGCSIEEAAKALSAYQGSGRRFEIAGEANGITVVNDYAHHPTKITATLSAARQRFPGRRLVAVWQPHTYSRTHALEGDFMRAIQLADLTIVTDIYAARENPENYSSRDLVDKVNSPSVLQIGNLDDVTDYLLTNLRAGDVLLVLSAGDADRVCRDVLSGLSSKERG